METDFGKYHHAFLFCFRQKKFWENEKNRAEKKDFEKIWRIITVSRKENPLLNINQIGGSCFDIFSDSLCAGEDYEGSCFYALQHYW